MQNSKGRTVFTEKPKKLPTDVDRLTISEAGIVRKKSTGSLKLSSSPENSPSERLGFEPPPRPPTAPGATLRRSSSASSFVTALRRTASNDGNNRKGEASFITPASLRKSNDPCLQRCRSDDIAELKQAVEELRLKTPKRPSTADSHSSRPATGRVFSADRPFTVGSDRPSSASGRRPAPDFSDKAERGSGTVDILVLDGGPVEDRPVSAESQTSLDRPTSADQATSNLSRPSTAGAIRRSPATPLRTPPPLPAFPSTWTVSTTSNPSPAEASKRPTTAPPTAHRPAPPLPPQFQPPPPPLPPAPPSSRNASPRSAEAASLAAAAEAAAAMASKLNPPRLDSRPLSARRSVPALETPLLEEDPPDEPPRILGNEPPRISGSAPLQLEEAPMQVLSPVALAGQMLLKEALSGNSIGGGSRASTAQSDRDTSDQASLKDSAEHLENSELSASAQQSPSMPKMPSKDSRPQKCRPRPRQASSDCESPGGGESPADRLRSRSPSAAMGSKNSAKSLQQVSPTRSTALNGFGIPPSSNSSPQKSPVSPTAAAAQVLLLSSLAAD
eukprot:TRINITY_DN14096_c0_g1_i1.p1 TRINITY_DN14096_c0_g1~~TRINITY_DN14096_c0_g1_i1.p1  ORF type:complete len:559 (-),score=94.66 TRINITY_DN14096_c0_g1_i1:91-1767(-)